MRDVFWDYRDSNAGREFAPDSTLGHRTLRFLGRIGEEGGDGYAGGRCLRIYRYLSGFDGLAERLLNPLYG